MTPANNTRVFWPVALVLLGLVFSCSTKKDTFINRQYHRLNTKYNVMFNGEEAFATGQTILAATVDDNFFELLEVEPILLSGESYDTNTVVPGFDRAEEKAVKAIQKHSMNIEGKQRNDQIDKAYLLLGKARYYDRRFFPALEAFNYILETYNKNSSYIEALIWREKTNIRLFNYELANSNLRSLARTLIPKSRFYGAANATMAQAFLKRKMQDSACFYIRRAAIHEKQKDLKGRYFYITGQLFEAAEKKDSAYWAYQQVLELKKKTPRKFWLNAKLQSLFLERELFEEDPEEAFLKLLKKYDNREYTHLIYRALGKYELLKENEEAAKDYLSASLRSNFIDPPTQRANYADLADFYFKKQDYLTHGAYLDSLIPLLPADSRIQKKTQRQRDNLQTVIQYETTQMVTDSLLHLMAMDTSAQRQFFETYLEAKKERLLAAAAKAAEAQEKGFFGGKKSSFYFYNPTLVAQGQQYFQATWGNRPNVDNWRDSQAIVANTLNTESNTVAEAGVQPLVLETVDFYLNSIPKTAEEKDSLQDLNAQALLQLGMVYKEKFKNNALATLRLEALLAKDPKPNYKVPGLYHLYKIFEQQDTIRAASLKTKIITAHAETAYAQILSDPENFDAQNLQTPQALYSKLLQHYQNQEFDAFLEKLPNYNIILEPTAFAPKLALINANVQARLHGMDAWKAALEQLIADFPQTTAAEKAAALLDKSNLVLQEDNLRTVLNYKWIFPLETAQNLQDSLRKQLQQLIQKQRGWTLSEDLFDAERKLFVVHGIRNPQRVSELKAALSPKKNIILEAPNHIVLSKAYRNMLKTKELKLTQ